MVLQRGKPIKIWGWAKPGEKKPNRAGLSRWGSWVNAYCREKYGRPLFLVCSADLAGSTNIAGFGAAYGPWFVCDNPVSVGPHDRYVIAPPAGFIAGVIAETPWISCALAMASAASIAAYMPRT